MRAMEGQRFLTTWAGLRPSIEPSARSDTRPIDHSPILFSSTGTTRGGTHIMYSLQWAS